MKKKIAVLCVVVIAILPLIVITPTMTGAFQRLPADLHISGLTRVAYKGYTPPLGENPTPSEGQKPVEVQIRT
jgi:hypothetical protein